MAVAKSVKVSVCSTGGELSCSVCLESFQEPKVLPCCHSFCLKCLEGTLERAKDKNRLTCPQCRTQHEVPPNGAQGFLNDYTLSQQNTLETKSSKKLHCDCEERVKAVQYCPTCSKYLCEECLKAHKRLYRYHVTVDVTSTELLPVVKSQSKKTYHCRLHPEEQLKLYCRKCQSVACLLCFVSSHNGHDIGAIDNKARKEVEKVIEDLVEETDSKLTEFEQNLQYISAVEKDKSEQSAPLKAEIDKKVDSMIAQLEARRAELHKEVDDAVTKDQKELWAQKEYHETNLVSLQGALSFARRSLDCQEDTELLALCAQVTTRLKELSQLKWDSQSTEKIEITVREFEGMPQETTWFRSQRPQKAFKLAGEVITNTFKPTLQLTPNPEPRSARIQRGSSKKFQIAANVRINRKQSHKTASLTCSALYRRTSHYKQPTNSLSVQKNTKTNSWVSTFTPLSSGQYSVTFTVQGSYGKERLSNQHSYNVEVLEQAHKQYQTRTALPEYPDSPTSEDEDDSDNRNDYSPTDESDEDY